MNMSRKTEYKKTTKWGTLGPEDGGQWTEDGNEKTEDPGEVVAIKREFHPSRIFRTYPG
jgi:hypothetical protein